MYRASVTASPENAAIYTEILFALGAASLSESKQDQGIVRLEALFFSEPEFSELSRHLNTDHIKISRVEQSQWKDTALKDFTGFELNDTLYVYSSDYAGPLPKRYPYMISLDARGAFGDGRHPTTAMCVSLINKFFSERDKSTAPDIIDIGTGTGILAIYCSMLGAGLIDAVDICPESIERAGFNAKINRADNIQFYKNDIKGFKITKKYDLVIANLQSALIEENIAGISQLGLTGSVYIISGIGSMNEKSVRNRIEPYLQIRKKLTHDGWAAFECAGYS